MPKTMPEPLDMEEVNAIISAAASDKFYYTLFTLAKRTGRRIGELYSIRVEDIDFKKKMALVKVLKTRKKQSVKEIVLNRDICDMLQGYITHFKLKSKDFLFKPKSMRSAQIAVKKYAKLAGINKNVVFHNFRHTLVTHLLKKGWSYDKVKQITGHSKADSLISYDHRTPDDVRTDFEQVMKGI